MPRQSVVTTNPIRILRLQQNKSLDLFSRECHVHLQALYLNECGVYPTILPAIMERLTRFYGLDRNRLAEEYGDFVKSTREEFGQQHSLLSYLPGDSDIRVSPITKLRNDFDLSKLGFAKGICTQPTGISRVEKRITSEFPQQLNEALLEAGLPVGMLAELQERQREYYG